MSILVSDHSNHCQQFKVLEMLITSELDYLHALLHSEPIEDMHVLEYCNRLEIKRQQNY